MIGKAMRSMRSMTLLILLNHETSRRTCEDFSGDQFNFCAASGMFLGFRDLDVVNPMVSASRHIWPPAMAGIFLGCGESFPTRRFLSLVTYWFQIGWESMITTVLSEWYWIHWVDQPIDYYNLPRLIHFHQWLLSFFLGHFSIQKTGHRAW